MASLRKLIADNIDVITEGVEWIIFYKEGRSWNVKTYFPKDGDYDTGYDFLWEDVDEMKQILKKDHKAIIINGYYNGYPSGEDISSKVVLVEDSLQRTEYLYYTRSCQLSTFMETNGLCSVSI